MKHTSMQYISITLQLYQEKLNITATSILITVERWKI